MSTWAVATSSDHLSQSHPTKAALLEALQSVHLARYSRCFSDFFANLSAAVNTLSFLNHYPSRLPPTFSASFPSSLSTSYPLLDLSLAEMTATASYEVLASSLPFIAVLHVAMRCC